MKKYLSEGGKAILALLFFGGVIANKAEAQMGISASITFQNFYDDLAPYGSWIEYPGYGHVWHPSVAGDFRPYLTNGYWNYTNDGWLWNSNYPWGWATFHYGRWLYDNYYGWLWIPGYEWSPAWVTWGDYDDYYAWAPLMPNVNVGFAFNSWRPSSFYWNVVGRDHMYDRDIDRWEKGRDFDKGFGDRVNIINHFGNSKDHDHYYAKGPEIGDVEKYTHRTIPPVAIKTVNKPSQVAHNGNNLRIYRPSVVHPQPREYRSVETTAPVRTQMEEHVRPYQEQKQNVERLPVHITPRGNYSNRGRSSNTNRGRSSKNNQR